MYLLLQMRKISILSKITYVCGKASIFYQANKVSYGYLWDEQSVHFSYGKKFFSLDCWFSNMLILNFTQFIRKRKIKEQISVQQVWTKSRTLQCSSAPEQCSRQDCSQRRVLRLRADCRRESPSACAYGFSPSHGMSKTGANDGFCYIEGSITYPPKSISQSFKCIQQFYVLDGDRFKDTYK